MTGSSTGRTDFLHFRNQYQHWLSCHCGVKDLLVWRVRYLVPVVVVIRNTDLLDPRATLSTHAQRCHSRLFECPLWRNCSCIVCHRWNAQLSVNIGVVLKASSAMVTAVFGDVVSPELLIFAMTGMFVAYGIAGGLNAAIVTDLIQGLLTIITVFLLLPLRFGR